VTISDSYFFPPISNLSEKFFSPFRPQSSFTVLCLPGCVAVTERDAFDILLIRRLSLSCGAANQLPNSAWSLRTFRRQILKAGSGRSDQKLASACCRHFSIELARRFDCAVRSKPSLARERSKPTILAPAFGYNAPAIKRPRFFGHVRKNLWRVRERATVAFSRIIGRRRSTTFVATARFIVSVVSASFGIHTHPLAISQRDVIARKTRSAVAERARYLRPMRVSMLSVSYHVSTFPFGSFSQNLRQHIGKRDFRGKWCY